MEAWPPETAPLMPRLIFRKRAYQLVDEPTSQDRITLSGRRWLSDQKICCGLIGSAETAARLLISCHQSSVFSISLSCHLRSVLRSTRLSSSATVVLVSPC